MRSRRPDTKQNGCQNNVALSWYEKQFLIASRTVRSSAVKDYSAVGRCREGDNLYHNVRRAVRKSVHIAKDLISLIAVAIQHTNQADAKISRADSHGDRNVPGGFFDETMKPKRIFLSVSELAEMISRH
ncbi:hypothetical protein llap_15684 [Limosa lapponica baueri]|uniref:Uncharacterized protein n=1 Tax=Limosa lapponica baueri TaxID=1758121 RepID=A0A2I0TJS6_LIMLA|nr:hypothetical protein llap_15684 [Limosa lapponica baueri]